MSGQGSTYDVTRKGRALTGVTFPAPAEGWWTDTRTDGRAKDGRKTLFQDTDGYSIDQSDFGQTWPGCIRFLCFLILFRDSSTWSQTWQVQVLGSPESRVGTCKAMQYKIAHLLLCQVSTTNSYFLRQVSTTNSYFFFSANFDHQMALARR